MTKSIGSIIGIIIGIMVAVALIVSAFVVRDGLLAISREVRDKPIPIWPEQIHLLAGDSPKLNIKVANLSVQPAKNDAELNISIDNLRIATPSLNPPAANNPSFTGKIDLTTPATQPTK